MLFQMQVLSGCLSWYCFDVNIVIAIKNIIFQKLKTLNLVGILTPVGFQSRGQMQVLKPSLRS